MSRSGVHWNEKIRRVYSYLAMDYLVEHNHFVKIRAVEIPCLTCPTWSYFIQDKLKISIYLSLDKYKCIKLIKKFKF